MLLIGLFISTFFIQFLKTENRNRKVLVLIALCVFLCVTFMDYGWLLTVVHAPFHPSDPSSYYEHVIGLKFAEVFDIESSNTFYFLINWFGWRVYNNPYVVSICLKLTNVFVFLTAYLLLTKKEEKLSCIDWLMLFNPYTLLTLVRNVRDMYIILFAVMILVGMGIIRNNKLNVGWTILAVILMLITRLVMLIPLLFVFIEKNKNRWSRIMQYGVFVIMGLVLFVYSDWIIQKIGNQMIPAVAEVGEDIEPYLPLLEGGMSLGVLKNIIIRLGVGFVSFLFTPHPINFISSWRNSMDLDGMSGIYTGTDNFLIAVGSVFNYLFVIPLIIYWLLNFRHINRTLWLFAMIYIILYVVSYLGISDIRNRNTAIFFVLAGIVFTADRPILTWKCYALTLCVFCVIWFMSTE